MVINNLKERTVAREHLHHSDKQQQVILKKTIMVVTRFTDLYMGDFLKIVRLQNKFFEKKNFVFKIFSCCGF